MEQANQYWIEEPIIRGFNSVRDIYKTIDGRGFIAGSYAAFMSYPHDDPVMPNDIDVFATSTENAEAITGELCQLYGLVADFNGIVYSLRRPVPDLSIQVVCPSPEWKVFPDDLMNAFDLDVCRALLLRADTVIADVNAGRREGKVLRTRNALRSLKRVMKYHVRGVEFSDWELLKLFQAWEATDADRKAQILEIAKPVVEHETIDSTFWTNDEDDWFEGE